MEPLSTEALGVFGRWKMGRGRGIFDSSTVVFSELRVGIKTKNNLCGITSLP